MFRYRFEGENELSGHSFGNLFITAPAQVYDGDVEEALEVTSKLLRVRGRVIPSCMLVAKEQGYELLGITQK